jgi:hypothetical protein
MHLRGFQLVFSNNLRRLKAIAYAKARDGVITVYACASWVDAKNIEISHAERHGSIPQ